MRLTAVVVKELIQLRRDVKTLALVALMPIVVITLFGWGYGGEVGHMPIALANLDEGRLGWIIVDVVKQSSAFNVAFYVNSLEEAEAMVRKAEASGAIVIPEGFTEDYLNGESFLILITDESKPDFLEI